MPKWGQYILAPRQEMKMWSNLLQIKLSSLFDSGKYGLVCLVLCFADMTAKRRSLQRGDRIAASLTAGVPGRAQTDLIRRSGQVACPHAQAPPHTCTPASPTDGLVGAERHHCSSSSSSSTSSGSNSNSNHDQGKVQSAVQSDNRKEWGR